MAKKAEQRQNKYKAKIEGSVVGKGYDATKELSVRQEKAATESLVSIENKVKAMLSGVSTIQLPYYIIFAKEIYRVLSTHTAKTAGQEICLLATKWESRGLEAEYLKRIVASCFEGDMLCPMLCDYPDVSEVLKDTIFGFGAFTGTYESPRGLPRTSQTTIYANFDDGYYKAGMPAGAGVRFVDNGDGTITDNATGLMWVKDPGGMPGPPFNAPMDWQAAIDACEALDFAGHTDWRLPNIKELMSIIDYSTMNPALDLAYFSPILAGPFWSSTTSQTSTDAAYTINLSFGTMLYHPKIEEWMVMPVRAGTINI